MNRGIPYSRNTWIGDLNCFHLPSKVRIKKHQRKQKVISDVSSTFRIARTR